MSFLPALFIVFLILKLMGYIAWSWWLVFIPLYPFFIFWGLILGGLVVYGVKQK